MPSIKEKGSRPVKPQLDPLRKLSFGAINRKANLVEFVSESALLPDTKLAEDHVQQILRCCLADDFAHRVDRDAQIQGHQFQRQFAAHSLERPHRRLARAAQRVLIP